MSAWTLPDLCRCTEAGLDERLTPQSLSRQKMRAAHRKSDEAAPRHFEKAGYARR